MYLGINNNSDSRSAHYLMRRDSFVFISIIRTAFNYLLILKLMVGASKSLGDLRVLAM